MPLEIGVSPSMLLFTGCAAVITGLVFGLLPALEAIHFPLADAMKAQTLSVKGMRLSLGRTLIAIQIVFSFVLLTAAILDSICPYVHELHKSEPRLYTRVHFVGSR